MNKNKSSAKKLSDRNLLEQALDGQVDITKRLDKLSEWNHELTKKMQVNQHSTDSLRYMMQSNTSSNQRITDLKPGRPVVSNEEAFEIGRKIHRGIIDEGLGKSIKKSKHRESIDAIAFLSEKNGRAQLQHERNNIERIELKEKIEELERQLTKTREESEARRCRLENQGSREKMLIEKIELIRNKVEKKSRIKKSYRRLVDARNIMKIIEPHTATCSVRPY